MKYKLFVWILILSLVCSLFACSQIEINDNVQELKAQVLNEDWSYSASDDHPIDLYYIPTKSLQYVNGSIYVFNRTIDDIVTLVRLDQESGNITSVCSDPLCNHNTIECPFGGNISGISIYQDEIYYWRSFMRKNVATGKYDQTIRQFCSYNLKTMNFTVHIEQAILNGISSGQYMKMLFADEYCYFYDYVYYKETDTYQWLLKKMNINSSDVSVVNEIENSTDFPADVFLFIIEDRIYFKNPGEIYSTDINLNNKIVHVKGKFLSEDIFTNGKYIFYSVLDESGMSETIHRVNLDGTNDVDLGISSAVNWCLTENYIYYFIPNQFDIPAGEDGFEVTMYFDSIFRCDFEGKNREHVITLDPKQNSEIDALYQLTEMVVAGNYIYSGFYSFKDVNMNEKVDAGEYVYNSLGVMRIDINEHTAEIIMQ